MTPTPVSVASDDQKIHVALHFDHFDLRSAVVLLTILFASHDTDASVSGII